MPDQQVAQREPGPFADKNAQQLLDFYTQVKGRVGVVNGLADKVKAELLRRAQEDRERTGLKPSWRADDASTMSYVEGDPDKIGVTDPDVLASWLAQRVPTEVTASISLDDPLALPGALEVLAAAGITVRTSSAAVRDAFLPVFLDACKIERVPVIRDKQEVLDASGIAVTEDVVYWTSTGEIVEGVGRGAQSAPYISIRLSQAAKERAYAAVLQQDPVLREVLAPTPAPAAEVIEQAPSVQDEDEDPAPAGEPVDDDEAA